MALPKLRLPSPLPFRTDEGEGDAPTDPRFFLVRRLAPRFYALPERWQRRILRAAAALGAIVAAVVALHVVVSVPPLSQWIDGRARRAVSERIAGAEIRGGVHVGWLGSVELDDLRLGAWPDGAVPVLSAERVTVRPTIGALLHGTLRAASISLRWVRLHPGRGGEGVHALLRQMGHTAHPAPPTAAGAAAHAPPVVRIRDLYVDPPTEAGAGLGTLGPLSLDVRWAHDGTRLRWTIDGALLDGRSGRFSVEGRADRATGAGEAQVRFERLRLVDLPPAWFQRFTARVLDGTLGGVLSVRRGEDGAVSGTARVALDGLSVAWPRLDPEPVSGLSFSLEGPFTWRPATKTFQTQKARIDLGGGAIDVDLRLALAAPRSVDVEVSLGDGLDLQKTIDSLPRAFQPPSNAPRVEGSLKADIALGGPLGEGLDGIEIRKADIDLRGLRQAARRDGDADFLRKPFRYTPRDDEGPHRSFEVGPANPHFVAIASLPPYVPRAVVASEDGGFFGHHGFDFDEIKDSIARDISSGEAVRGGSTITQQLVKNLFLSRTKTLARKIREALVTLQVEATLPKWRILELYLNTIEWGPDVYGLGEAANRYFGVAPAQLAPKEAAFLATIIPSPKRYYQLYYLRGALTPHWEERVDRVLSLLHENGVLDDAAFEQAEAAPLVFRRGGARGEAERSARVPPAPPERERSLWERLFGR